MHARITRVEGSPEQLEDGIANVTGAVIPAAKGMAGFAGAYFLADRSSGTMLGITLWDSEEALRASEEAAEALRRGAASASGGQIASVERYEVVAQV